MGQIEAKVTGCGDVLLPGEIHTSWSNLREAEACACQNLSMASETPTSSSPRVFISYASEPELDEWVLKLATRLEHNGVAVVLDQWDLGVGANLGSFMEQGLTSSDRVICVCSDTYVKKANAGLRGVGYEKKIMAAPMLVDSNLERIVPVLFNVTSEPLVPTFLSGVRYIDFRDQGKYEENYRELVHAIYGESITPRPKRGPNPFSLKNDVLTAIALSHDPTAFQNTDLEGTVSFRYTDNSGIYRLGTGLDEFDLSVSTAGPGSVHVVRDPSNIHAIALAQHAFIEGLRPLESYDWSSRVRTVRVGDTVLLANESGRIAAVEVHEVTTRDTSTDGVPIMVFRFEVLTTDGADLSDVTGLEQSLRTKNSH